MGLSSCSGTGRGSTWVRAGDRAERDSPALPLCQREQAALGHFQNWDYSHAPPSPQPQWIPGSHSAFPLFKLTLSFGSHSILEQSPPRAMDVPHLYPECHQGEICDQFLRAPLPCPGHLWQKGLQKCKTSLRVLPYPSPLLTLAALLSSFSFTPASFWRQDNEKSMDYSNHGHSIRLIISILKTLLS